MLNVWVCVFLSHILTLGVPTICYVVIKSCFVSYCAIVFVFCVRFVFYTSGRKYFCWSINRDVCFLYCGDPNVIHIIFIEVSLHLKRMCLEFRGLAPLEIMNVVNHMSCYRCVNTVFCDFFRLNNVNIKTLYNYSGLVIYISPSSNLFFVMVIK